MWTYIWSFASYHKLSRIPFWMKSCGSELSKAFERTQSENSLSTESKFSHGVRLFLSCQGTGDVKMSNFHLLKPFQRAFQLFHVTSNWVLDSVFPTSVWHLQPNAWDGRRDRYLLIHIYWRCWSNTGTGKQNRWLDNLPVQTKLMWRWSAVGERGGGGLGGAARQQQGELVDWKQGRASLGDMEQTWNRFVVVVVVVVI